MKQEKTIIIWTIMILVFVNIAIAAVQVTPEKEAQINQLLQQTAGDIKGADEDSMIAYISLQEIGTAAQNKYNTKSYDVISQETKQKITEAEQKMMSASPRTWAVSDSLKTVAPPGQVKGGGGFSLGWTLAIVALLLIGGAFLWKRYAHENYMFGRNANKIIKSERFIQKLMGKEELNLGTIDKIEKEKEKLIEENIKLSGELEEDEQNRLKLDNELRKKTRFKEGIYDKRLASQKDLKETLKSFKISEDDAKAIEDLVKGRNIPVMHKLHNNILKIKRVNMRIDNLIEKDIVLDNDMMDKLLEEKKQINISNIKLNELRDFVVKAER
jgi:hypothetical protein